MPVESLKILTSFLFYIDVQVESILPTVLNCLYLFFYLAFNT